MRKFPLPCLLSLSMLVAGCAATMTGGPSIRIELPATLEADRADFVAQIDSSLHDVGQCFESWDLPPAGDLIDSVVVFDSTAAAREGLSKAFEIAVETVPETFSGTVVGNQLFVVAPAAYEATWRTLYAQWPWTAGSYHGLLVHELAHRAHEASAIARKGSADAMGPTWLFEGLAVACAEQFESAGPLMPLDEIKLQVGAGRTPEVSYPLYGEIVRSLAAVYGMRALIERAHEADFPDSLWED